MHLAAATILRAVTDGSLRERGDEQALHGYHHANDGPERP